MEWKCILSELFNMNIANTKKDNTGNDYTGPKALDKYKKQIEKVGLSYVVLTLDVAVDKVTLEELSGHHRKYSKRINFY